MKTKFISIGAKLLFTFLSFMIFSMQSLILAQSNEIINAQSKTILVNVNSKISTKINGEEKLIFLDSFQSYSEYTNLQNQKMDVTSWTGGTNPLINFILSNDLLIDTFKITYTIATAYCTTTITNSFSNVEIKDGHINIDWKNRYFNGFSWITDSIQINGDFSNDMNSIIGTYSLTSGSCGASLSGDWSATPILSNGLVENIENFVFLIYPNPTNGIITIESVISSYYFNLYSLEGKKLITKMFNENVNNIDLNNLSHGIYIIKLENSKKVIIEKLLKQ